MQSTEALLRFSYSESKQILLKSKAPEYYSGPLLGKLFGLRYIKKTKEIEDDQSVNQGCYKDADLFRKLQESVLNKRNELSHYECVLHDNKNNVIEPMINEMGGVVKSFLEMFAKKYEIDAEFFESFSKRVTFLQIDDNLNFNKTE